MTWVLRNVNQILLKITTDIFLFFNNSSFICVQHLSNLQIYHKGLKTFSKPVRLTYYSFNISVLDTSKNLKICHKPLAFFFFIYFVDRASWGNSGFTTNLKHFADQHVGQSPCQCVIPEDVLVQLFPLDDERFSLETCRGRKINTLKKVKKVLQVGCKPIKTISML
jgi:hypothetical protein